jgi:hypothetical protein
VAKISVLVTDPATVTVWEVVGGRKMEGEGLYILGIGDPSFVRGAYEA